MAKFYCSSQQQPQVLATERQIYRAPAAASSVERSLDGRPSIDFTMMIIVIMIIQYQRTYHGGQFGFCGRHLPNASDRHLAIKMVLVL